MAMVSVIHPHLMHDDVLRELLPQIDVWLTIHFVQLVLIWLLGLVIWLLLDGINNRPARIARIAISLFLVFYSAFDSVVGLGMGVLTSMAAKFNDPTAALLVQQYWNARFTAPVGPVILVADLSWITALVASALALRRVGASWLVAGLLMLAGIAMGIDHPFPFGTVAMVSLLLAIVLLHRRTVHQSSYAAVMNP